MRPELIVGYDASPAAEAALQTAMALAGPLGAVVVAAHVYPPAGALREPEGDPVPLTALAVAQQAGAERAAALLERADADELVAVCAPWVAPALRELALAREAVLLLVGTSSRRRRSRLAESGLVGDLLVAPPCPVVAVPPVRASGPRIAAEDLVIHG